MKAKMSIKRKLQVYLIAFSTAILVVLWMFQVVFLDDIYRYIKMQEISSLATSIKSDYLQEGTLDSTTDASNKEIHVRIVNSDGLVVHNSVGIPNNQVQDMMPNELKAIFDNLGSKGRVVQTGSKNPIGEKDPSKPKTKNNLTYALKIDDHTMVVIQTKIMPVDSTVNTIRIQLLAVSVFLIALSVIISRILYNRISKPIIEINDKAKILARGNYDVPFMASGYLEIEELSDTLNQARKDLSQVETMRNELISNVGHDLKTPLTMIGGYAELMKDIPEEMTQENLDVIIEETKRLNRLVTDILDLSLLQSGMSKLKKESYDIAEVLGSFVKRIRTYYPDRLIHLTSPEKVMVAADKSKIEQVIYNLVLNALTHTQKEVFIEVTPENGFVKISIRDQGPGMDDVLLNNIWTRYYRSQKDHQRSDYGSGLGLSIVKNIFDTHDILYGVESDIESGTTFWFELRESMD